MVNNNSFQKRIGYEGDIKPILLDVCKKFALGKYASHKTIPMGYEDFNLVLNTTNGNFFVKMFANFRNAIEIERYVDVMTKALEVGVHHPNLYKSSQGYLYKLSISGHEISLCVMEKINGVSFYEKNLKATANEMRFLIKQASLINKINLNLKPVYDSWAIIHFLKEYDKKKQYLNKTETNLINPLAKEFSLIKVNELPYCFVHGDIIKTNVIKDKNGKLFIIDFSVSSYYPRIQELAVLLCNMLFDENKLDSFQEYYQLALNEYQKYIKLTQVEIGTLPLFVKVAHAMHILCATYEKVVKKNNTAENDYWINLGKIGLKFTTSNWRY